MKRVFLFAVLAALVAAAGCIGEDGGGATGAVPANATNASADIAVGDLEVIATQELPARSGPLGEGGAYEPIVRVAADGAIYVTAQAVDKPEGPPALLWISHDRGASFDRVAWADAGTGVSNLPAGVEGDIGFDAAGNVYFVDMRDVGSEATVARSTDGGHTWELRNPGAFLEPVTDRPWVEGRGEDEVVVASDRIYEDVLRIQAPKVAVSTDGGLTFPVQTVLEPCVAFPKAERGSQDGAFYQNGDLAVAPDGTIYLSVNCLGHGIEVHRSTDGGGSFEAFAVRENPHVGPDFSPVAVDEAGNAYVAWRGHRNGTSNVYYAASTDHGETWSDPVRISVHEGATLMPWIEAREEGHLAIAYYGAPGFPGVPHELGADASWFPFTTEVRSAATDQPSLLDARMSDAPVAKGPQCGPQDPCPEDAGTDLIDYLGTDVGPDGRVHVAWTTDHEDRPPQVSWGVAEADSGVAT